MRGARELAPDDARNGAQSTRRLIPEGVCTRFYRVRLVMNFLGAPPQPGPGDGNAALQVVTMTIDTMFKFSSPLPRELDPWLGEFKQSWRAARCCSLQKSRALLTGITQPRPFAISFCHSDGLDNARRSEALRSINRLSFGGDRHASFGVCRWSTQNDPVSASYVTSDTIGPRHLNAGQVSGSSHNTLGSSRIRVRTPARSRGRFWS